MTLSMDEFQSVIFNKKTHVFLESKTFQSQLNMWSEFDHFEIQSHRYMPGKSMESGWESHSWEILPLEGNFWSIE